MGKSEVVPKYINMKKNTIAVKKVAPKKTVTKKVVAKKVAPKKVPTKLAAGKKSLTLASNESSFWTADGQILNSLQALESALASMKKEVFSHHVGKDKNDFADWVDSVLCDSDCSSDLRKAKTAKTAKATVTGHLASYKI